MVEVEGSTEGRAKNGRGKEAPGIRNIGADCERAFKLG